VARRCSKVGETRKAAVFKGAILGFPSFDGQKLDRKFTQSWPGLKSMMAGVCVRLGGLCGLGYFRFLCVRKVCVIDAPFKLVNFCCAVRLLLDGTYLRFSMTDQLRQRPRQNNTEKTRLEKKRRKMSNTPYRARRGRKEGHETDLTEIRIGLVMFP
jgi:hypothetical protein